MGDIGHEYVNAVSWFITCPAVTAITSFLLELRMKVSLSQSLQIQKRNHVEIGKQLLEKTSFHALPWLLENVSWLSKVLSRASSEG